MKAAPPSEALRLLEEAYPSAPQVALDYETPLQLLIATVLSAQCTDQRVNIVTKTLFRKYKTAKDYAEADIKALEAGIRSTGFYHNKARNIKAAAGMIVNEYGGNVPETMEDLLRLPGVARKTANIVLTAAFGKVEGIAVDTHVRRLSQRIGLSSSDDPVRIEADLMGKCPRDAWPKINKLLVAHGRQVCQAKKPMCNGCVLAGICLKIGVNA
ncbi:MAG: endonuclease III [Candidatus Altiarchaeota archaeon]